MGHQLITQLRLHTWSREITKDYIASSVFGQFSNINVETARLPKDKDNVVPKTAIHYLLVEFKENAFSTTIPLLKSLVKPGVGGRQVAKGTGERPQVRYGKVHWQRNRKVINADRQGVDIKSQEYLQLAKKQYMLLGDWSKQDEDFAFQRAICEGADIYLTEPEYWIDYELQNTPPVVKFTNPNVCFPGMNASTIPVFPTAAPILSEANNAAYTNSIADKLGAALSVDSKFNMNALNKLMKYVRGHIKPIDGKTQYIVLLSSVQAAQLRGDPDFLSVNMNADERGDDNRAISGVIGTWQGFKFIEDMRSPIFTLDSANRGFKYVTYENGTTVDRLNGIASLPREAKGSGTVGTCEVARVLGVGAIGVPMVDGHNLSFEEESTDFKEFGEICARKNMGHCRLDFSSGDNSILENKSSALFFTATPTDF
jgi:N4-gp56 family major capsid protein